MSRKTFLTFTAAALAIGTLASTSASAFVRPGHLPSSAAADSSSFLRPHFPSAATVSSSFLRPHFPSAATDSSGFIRPHFAFDRFPNVHHLPLYQGGGYAGYQGGGYAPVAAYTPPARIYVAPAPGYTPAPASCLSKIYQQDGSALFTDNCTGEQAATAPAYPRSGS